MRTAKQLLRTAYHEAGHVFAHHQHGLVINYVTVTPRADALGYVRLMVNLRKLVESGQLSDRQTQKYYKYCVALFAGHASEKHYLGSASYYSSSADREKAIDIAMALFGNTETVSAALRLFRLQAEAMVQTPIAGLLIPPLAEELVKHGTLKHSAVQSLFKEIKVAKFQVQQLL